MTREQAPAGTHSFPDPVPAGAQVAWTAGPFAELRSANLERQEAWKVGGDTGAVGGLFRAVELGGEAGEVLNVVKKLERETRGWRGSRSSVADLADELGDVVICADLLAAEYGIDLWSAIVAKFNATSEKVGLSTRLARTPSNPEGGDDHG